MKLVTYISGDNTKTGVMSADETCIYPVTAAGFDDIDMQMLIEKADDAGMASLKALSEKTAGDVEGAVRTADTVLEAPIMYPKQDVICLGINYMAHAEESARYKKEAFGGDRPFPIYFSKRVNKAVAPEGTICAHADMVDSLDYEAELAVIIGKDAKDVSAEDVKNYIFGYTVLNDVSARNVQTRHKQWYFGKSLDDFTPIGPCILTADAVSYPPVVRIQSLVNGELRQNSTTDLLIHDIDYIVAELSQGMTLKAGTIISTGTPAGVGMGFQPPRFLKAGDVVECRIEGIGSIINKIVD